MRPLYLNSPHPLKELWIYSTRLISSNNSRRWICSLGLWETSSISTSMQHFSFAIDVSATCSASCTLVVLIIFQLVGLPSLWKVIAKKAKASCSDSRIMQSQCVFSKREKLKKSYGGSPMLHLAFFTIFANCSSLLFGQLSKKVVVKVHEWLCVCWSFEWDILLRIMPG